MLAWPKREPRGAVDRAHLDPRRVLPDRLPPAPLAEGEVVEPEREEDEDGDDHRRVALERGAHDHPGVDPEVEDHPAGVVDQRGEQPPAQARVEGISHSRDAPRSGRARRCRRPPPSRSISSGRMPAARAPATSSSLVSPTCSASAASQPASSRATAKIPGSGLREPASAEVTVPSSSSSSPHRSSTRGSEQSQLETDDQPQAAVPQAGRAPARRRGRPRSGPPRPARRPLTSTPSSLGDQRGAALAQLRERLLVAPLVRVLPVVVHLGPHRGDQPLVADLGGNPLAQGDPGRLELDQRSEGIEEDGAGPSR